MNSVQDFSYDCDDYYHGIRIIIGIEQYPFMTIILG